MEENTKINSNRRAALKALAAATGAAGLAALPSQWSKPALMVGAVPAHAQTSCVQFALLIENIVATGTTWGGSTPTEPVIDEADRVAWSCSTGCLYFGLYNINDFGSITFDVTVLDTVSFPIGLGPSSVNGQWWIGINLDTLAWDDGIGDGGSGVNWAGIGCSPPPD